MDNLQENFKYLDRISLMSVGNCISNACSNIIEATMVRTRNLSVNQDLTKSIGADYNKINENNNELGGIKMLFDQMTKEMMIQETEFLEMENTDEIISKIKEKTLNNLENEKSFMEKFPNPTYAVMRLDFLTETSEEKHYQMLIDLYKEKKLLMHLMEVQKRAIHFMREENRR